MQSLEPHETVFDHLVEWQEGMKTIFFSHTWLNFAHPDHDGHKFGLMSELLSRARDGRLHMSTYFKTWIEMGELSPPAKTFQKDVSDGYIWLDFWCIPQAAEAASQRAAAISCITEYISRSSHFIVLAGPWRHGGNGSIRDVHACGGRAAGAASNSWRTRSHRAPSRNRSSSRNRRPTSPPMRPQAWAGVAGCRRWWGWVTSRCRTTRGSSAR